MPDPVEVRHIGPEDMWAFKQLRLEALQVEPHAFASTYKDWVTLPDSVWIERLTESPVFVAFRGGVPVGLMGLLRERPSKMAHRASLIMVYVQPQERGAGVAAQLLAAADQHAATIGITQIELNASAENPGAIRFYEREGFVEYGRLPAGFVHEGRGIDDVLMVRPVGRGSQSHA